MDKINPIFSQGVYHNSKIKNEKDYKNTYNGNIYSDYQAYIKSQQKIAQNGDGEEVTTETDENGYTTETVKINGVITKETIRRPEGSVCTINDYQNGIISKSTNYTQNKEIASIITFNDKGIQKEYEDILNNSITKYNEKGNLLTKTEFGKIVEEKTYYADGITPKSELEYKGRLHKIEKIYNENGKILSRYDEQLPRNIIDWIFDGNPIIKDGQPTDPNKIYNQTDIDNLLQQMGKTREEYNEYVTYINNCCSYDTYEYDSNNRMTEHITYTNDKKTVQNKITYEYQDNTVTEKEFDSNGNLERKFQTTTKNTALGTHEEEKVYDAENNLLAATIIDYDKNNVQQNLLTTFNDGTYESQTRESTDNGYKETYLDREGRKIITYYTIKDNEETQTRLIIINPDGSIETDENYDF